jgi:hypothetical protein
LPGLESLLPVAVVLQAVAGRPTPATWSRLSAAAVLVSVTGWGDRELSYGFPGELLSRLMAATVLSAAALAILVFVGHSQGPLLRRLVATSAAFLTLFWVGPDAYARARARWERATGVTCRTGHASTRRGPRCSDAPRKSVSGLLRETAGGVEGRHPAVLTCRAGVGSA